MHKRDFVWNPLNYLIEIFFVSEKVIIFSWEPRQETMWQTTLKGQADFFKDDLLLVYLLCREFQVCLYADTSELYVLGRKVSWIWLIDVALLQVLVSHIYFCLIKRFIYWFLLLDVAVKLFYEGVNIVELEGEQFILFYVCYIIYGHWFKRYYIVNAFIYENRSDVTAIRKNQDNKCDLKLFPGFSVFF